MVENDISKNITGAAIEVHRFLGPGLLESAYSSCLAREFTLQGLNYICEMPLDIIYKGETIDAGYRLDFFVEDRVIIELKSVEKLLPIHDAQLLSYLRISNNKSGLLINFNTTLLRYRIKRLVNDL